MYRILILGAGKIGSLISVLLANTNEYEVYLADIQIDTPLLKEIASTTSCHLIRLDVSHSLALEEFIQKHPVDAVASCLPYYYNIEIAEWAKKWNLHYFDLTEDVHTAHTITTLAQDSQCAFIPQCGLAPGFINIAAHHFMQHFSALDSVKLRVGALPVNSSNTLQYALTWSTDGLINEYGNPCSAIENGKIVQRLPLEDREEIEIDGLTYEAFNTSGGIGSLPETYIGQVQTLNYKTIRYPGHGAKMHFLMHDLKLNHDRDTLKRILENSLPQTKQDVVLIYISITGTQEGQFMEENYVKKLYPKTINGVLWSAIQITTASSLCTIVDTVFANPGLYHGLVKQEQFSLDHFLKNRFGKCYASEAEHESSLK